MPELLADDGVRLSYTDHGDPAGAPVVLLAGFKAPATSWRFQVPALVAAGYRVLAVDLRGHGLAERPDGQTMSRRAADVANVLEHLGFERVALVGGSMGGNTIWAYLDAYGAGRVTSVVIVDQTPKMLGEAGWPFGFYGYTPEVRDTYFAERIPPTGHGTPMLRRGRRLVRLLAAMRGADGKLSSADLALLHDHATADWRGVIADSTLPILFVAGAESEFWPAEHAEAAASLTPTAESAVIPKDGHAANIEQPAAFNALLLDFLRRSA
ncbi:alpha/beta fold hydrolase [Agromyces seonyuensis]|uniref:Alpha/beta fold hydrolase n=1 Tax=Agromyces seonyuensis TaxID=2662446 RepID=A0A6I4P202_9MICO|nr:alpha/beta hydrolase [Agromyces seonyuensis]MWB99602.1 alpha/beta fold hydrolase [Agromyces seonyuensis]